MFAILIWPRSFYYTEVHRTIWLRALVAVTLLTAGCDRNATPEMVGRTAPDFSVTDSDRTVALHDYRGRVVVLNFWVSWCGPCIEEVPALVAMHHTLKDQVSIVAVSIDEDENAYRRFLTQHNVDFLTVRDPERKSYNMYQTTGYPETFIIDQAGVVRRKLVGPVEWTKPEVLRYLTSLQAGRPSPAFDIKSSGTEVAR